MSYRELVINIRNLNNLAQSQPPTNRPHSLRLQHKRSQPLRRYPPFPNSKTRSVHPLLRHHRRFPPPRHRHRLRRAITLLRHPLGSIPSLPRLQHAPLPLRETGELTLTEKYLPRDRRARRLLVDDASQRKFQAWRYRLRLRGVRRNA